ncbi:MAG: DUF748 domain-containing protein [Candidatus Omnitrophica bacterium]|nr:DUF748 domain-containing protein [Candidatus Omnitrophota bacterium]
MKLWIKILFAGIFLLAGIFTASYVFLVVKGQGLITEQLERITHRKVTIGQFNIQSPLTIEIKQLNIDGFASADSLYIYPSILGFLSGYVVFNEVVINKPRVQYTKTIPTVIDASTTLALTPSIAKLKQKYPLRFIVKDLRIQDGALTVIDQTVAPEGLKLSFQDITVHVSNLLYLVSRSAVTTFEIKSNFPWQQSKDVGRIAITGWVNVFKKDMKSTVKIEGINGVYIFPYVSPWFSGLDLKKARIEQAKLNFFGDINGLNNDVTIDGQIELVDIVRKPVEAEEVGPDIKIADREMNFFLAFNEGKIVVKFKSKTAMDRPEFRLIDIKMAFEEKVLEARKAAGIKPADVLGIPAKVVTGTFKGFGDVTSALIMGTVSAGKEIGKAVGAAFRREK